jgi:hypothetical protein
MMSAAPEGSGWVDRGDCWERAVPGRRSAVERAYKAGYARERIAANLRSPLLVEGSVARAPQLSRSRGRRAHSRSR